MGSGSAEQRWGPFRFTDDDGVVVGDEHLAVDVDELRHQLPLQRRVGPQTSDGDVVHPRVAHWEERRRRKRWRRKMRIEKVEDGDGGGGGRRDKKMRKSRVEEEEKEGEEEEEEEVEEVGERK